MKQSQKREVEKIANNVEIAEITVVDPKMTPEDQQGISGFQTDWQAATTDEQRAIASAGAEAIRAKYGFSGGTDGTQYIQLPGQPQGIPGSPGVPGTSANKGRDIAVWDREILSPEDFQKIQQYQQLWQDDPTQRDSAARAAAAIREKYGYSGGADGSQYTPLDQFKPPTAPTIDDYESPFQEQLDKMFDTIQNPPEYESKYGDLIDQQISNIINRPKFEYNPDTDPAYQAFMQKALRAGDKAYNDNLAGMSAMTGGRPNSWAGSVASQARNEYVLQAQEAVIHFEERAYGRYRDETADMYNLVNLLNSQDEIAYSRFRDTMTDTKDFANLLLQLDDREFEKYKYKAENQWRTFEAEYTSYKDELTFKKDKVAEAIDRTNLLGYVNNQDAITLGVKVGTLSQAARERAEAMEDYLQMSEIDLDKELQIVEAHHKNDLTIISAREESDVRKMGVQEQIDYRMMDREEQQWYRKASYQEQADYRMMDRAEQEWYRKLSAQEQLDYRMMDKQEQLDYRLMNAQANVADGGWASGSVAGGSSGDLGSVAAKYESGGSVGMVSSGKGDHGGVSYGVHQFSSKQGSAASFVKFAQNNGYQYANELANSGKPGSASFGKAWKNIAAKDPEGFKAIQHKAIQTQYYDPAVASVKKATGIDVNARSKGLQETIWSTAVQHGSGSVAKIVQRALSANSSGKTDDAALIKAIYAERGANNGGKYFPSSSKAVQKSVANRFKKEVNDMLAFANTSSGPVGGARPGAATQAAKPTTIAEGNKMNSLVKDYDTLVQSENFKNLNNKGKYDAINKKIDNIIIDYKNGALGPNGEWIANEALGKLRNTQSYKKYVVNYEGGANAALNWQQRGNDYYVPPTKINTDKNRINTQTYKPGQTR